MKYAYHPDLKPYEKQKAILNPAADRVLQTLMRVLYRLERDDEQISVTQWRIPAADGAQIRLLRYTPKQRAGRTPCLIFLHGGGFVFNAAPHHFALARRLTKELQVQTIFVDYRLTPKYKFPTAPQDVLCAYRWTLAHADSLGVDAGQMLVCGDSAGGNLAAALCLMARDQGLTLPQAQMLLYPVLDRRMNTPSYRRYTDMPMCNSEDMRRYFQMYGGTSNAAQVPYLSPMEAPSLAGLPPAYVEVAQFDCLHDEGVAYAEALRKFGVPAELHEVADTMHGYDIAQNSRLMAGVMDMRLAFLRKIMGEKA